MPRDPLLTIRLPHDLRTAVTDLAEQQGVSRSELVRQALEAATTAPTAGRRAA